MKGLRWFVLMVVLLALALVACGGQPAANDAANAGTGNNAGADEEPAADAEEEEAAGGKKAAPKWRPSGCNTVGRPVPVRRLLCGAGERLLRRRVPGGDHPRRRGGDCAAAGWRRATPNLVSPGCPNARLREQGADLVNIAQIFQRSGTMQIAWADSDHPVDDWAARVGTWGFGNEWEVFAALRQAASTRTIPVR